MYRLVLAGSQPDDFLELVVEMWEVIKTGFKTHLRNTQLIIDQQLACVADFYFIKKLRVGLVGAGFEITAKGSYTHISHGRDLFQCRVLDIMIHNVLI